MITQQFGCYNSPDEYPVLTRGPVYGPFSKDPDLVPKTARDEYLDLIEHAALQLKHCAMGDEYRQKKNAGR